MSNDHNLRQLLVEYLESGESVRWTQSPDPAAFAREARGLLYFSIPWLAFIAFWTSMASQGSSIFAAFSIPFWLIGVWMATAPIRARKRAANTLYAITNKRAVILDAHKGRIVRSFYPGNLTDITLVESSPERGDIILGHDISQDSDGDATKKKVGFIGITRPKEVNKLLRDLTIRPSSHP